MKKLLLSLAVAALGLGTAMAGDVQEVLTVDLFSGITKATTYADVEYTSPVTGITYKGNIAATKYENGKPAGCIQMRTSNSKEGLVATANPKGAIFKSVKVETGEDAKGGATAAGRVFQLFGKAAAYTGANQLYATEAGDQGTKIGEGKIIDNPTIAAEAGQNFPFIGMRDNSGACYIAKITITYEIAGQTGKKSADLKFSESAVTIKYGDAFTAPTLTKATTAAVVYSSSDAAVAEVNAESGAVAIKGIGTATITAKTAENDEYYAGEASYTITVKSDKIVWSTAYEGFTSEIVSGEKDPWTTDAAYKYIKGNGFIDGASNATDARMVSPVVDLTNYVNATVNFEHVINFFKENNPTEFLSVEARAEGATEWTKLAEPTMPEKDGWTPWVASGDLSLSAFDGKKVQIAFHYVSTAEVCGAWEVKNIEVKADKKGEQGIDSAIIDENAPAVYYNLQGVRVENPTEGLYICVQGKKATKVMIRK